MKDERRDERNAGTYIEVDGVEGGPQTTMRREEAMAAEVARNDPQDKAGLGANMEPSHDLGSAYHYYERDATDPARPVTGLDTPDPDRAAQAPVPASARREMGTAEAEEVRRIAEQSPLPDGAYAAASTISAMEDAERQARAFSTEGMHGVAFARNLIFSGSTSFAPVMQALVDGFTQKFGTWRAAHPSLPMAQIAITVDPVGTAQGMQKVLAGEADFLMASCPVPYTDYQKFGEFREAFEVAHQLMAIGVNAASGLPADTLGGLSRDDYRCLFSGHVRVWSDIDPRLPQEPVSLYVAEEGSGMARVFDDEIMMETAVSPDAHVCRSARDLAPAIASDPWAIGYAPLQDVDALNAGAFKIAPLEVDGNEPNAETLANGRYPLAQPFLLMTPRRADPFVRVLLEFVYGQEGHAIIEARGCYPAFKPGDTKQIYVSEPYLGNPL